MPSRRWGNLINYKKGVKVWYRGGCFEKESLDIFSTNFFKVIILVFRKNFTFKIMSYV